MNPTLKKAGAVGVVSAVVALLFALLYVNARRAVINEIRHQVMGVAAAVSLAISPEDLEQIRGPEDMSRPAYSNVQALLQRVVDLVPDVRYVYTMRRAQREDAAEHEFEYIVDGPPRDDNRDGVIGIDERSEPPGKPYSAQGLPEMIAGWHRVTADWDISPDPPYPDMISGYAPVRNARGQTVGMVGVDITAATVAAKLLTLRIVIALVWLVITLLMGLVVYLYHRSQEALEANRALSAELAARNEMLRAANAELAAKNEQFVRELKLAQSVQLGFLPQTFPRQDKVAFERYYLTCEMLGGDLFDVFMVDEDRIGMYVADVAGHGVSAALISGLLKMAVNALREPSATEHSGLAFRLAEPHRALAVINDMLVDELPQYEFITMIYAVYDVAAHVFRVASAGHLAPLAYVAREGRVVKWDVPTGVALGLIKGCEYTVMERAVRPGDKVLFYTDGAIEAMNREGTEFGEANLRQVFEQAAGEPLSGIIAAITAALELHRSGERVSDDYSLLLAEIR